MKYDTGPWRACPCECGMIWSQAYDYVVARVERFDDNHNGLYDQQRGAGDRQSCQPIDDDAFRTTIKMIEAAPEMLELLRLIVADERGGFPLGIALKAMEIIDRIDNPAEDNRIPDHRSPFEKMTT